MFVLLRKLWSGIILAILLLIGGEVLLQVRSHLRYGMSVFNAVDGEKTYVVNPDSGLKTFRPNASIEGKQITIESNSLGLRMSELPPVKPEDEVWIAFLGASTVVGAFTKTNQSTLSARLEVYLQPQFQHRRIRVINAGMTGYGLKNQGEMLMYLLSKYSLDGVVLYPGFNDIARYCRAEKSASQMINDYALMDIEAPKWLLTVELITKNTVKLRDIPAGKPNILDPSEIDSSAYRKSAKKLFEQIVEHVPHSLVVLNARSFRPEMPIAQQAYLSQTARYYLPCFSLDGLHQIYDQHNDILAEEAENVGISSYDLMTYLPGGQVFFADATHFSDKGTDLAASLIARQVMSWASQ